MSTETTCPCCGVQIDALRIIEKNRNCPNPECRATREEMFRESIDDDDENELPDDCRGIAPEIIESEEPTIVYPFNGSARTV